MADLAAFRIVGRHPAADVRQRSEMEGRMRIMLDAMIFCFNAREEFHKPRSGERLQPRA